MVVGGDGWVGVEFRLRDGKQDVPGRPDLGDVVLSGCDPVHDLKIDPPAAEIISPYPFQDKFPCSFRDHIPAELLAVHAGGRGSGPGLVADRIRLGLGLGGWSAGGFVWGFLRT